MAERLLYKTPSPVTVKHAVPDGRGRAGRVVSEQAQRIHKDWRELQGGRNRGSSLGSSSEHFRNLREEVDSIDSTMGFRELERHIAKIKRQNFDLKLELHIRRERMTANADRLHRAERLEYENEQLRKTLRETCVSLESRDEELSDCKALIQLLSDQLENANKRIEVFSSRPRSVQSTEESSCQSGEESIRGTPILKNAEPVDTPPEGSPRSLVSLESSIGSYYGEGDHDINEKIKASCATKPKDLSDSIKEIHIPFKLEHPPKSIRGRFTIDPTSPTPQTRSRMSFNNDHRQFGFPNRHSPRAVELNKRPSKRNPKPTTLNVSKVDIETPKAEHPLSPHDPSIPTKSLEQRAPSTLRGRIFRSKSDLRNLKVVESPETSPSSVAKNSSFIRFWKSKSTSPLKKNEESNKHATNEALISPPTPKKSPKPQHRQPTNLVNPHESDKHSRYRKLNSVRLSIPRPSPGVIATTPNPEWRRSVGRQVAEMVQHWEEETSRTDITSCTNYVATKRFSNTSFKDVSTSRSAVRAARDAWDAKLDVKPTPRATSLRSAEEITKLARRKDELARKLGFRDV